MKTICINCGEELDPRSAFFDCLLPLPKVKGLRYGRCGPCQKVGRAQNDRSAFKLRLSDPSYDHQDYEVMQQCFIANRQWPASRMPMAFKAFYGLPPQLFLMQSLFGEDIGKLRDQLVQELEDVTRSWFEKHPGEQGDIEAAVHYWRGLPMHELVDEHNDVKERYK